MLDPGAGEVGVSGPGAGEMGCEWAPLWKWCCFEEEQGAVASLPKAQQSDSASKKQLDYFCSLPCGAHPWHLSTHKRRQEDDTFQVGLGYIVRLCFKIKQQNLK